MQVPSSSWCSSEDEEVDAELDVSSEFHFHASFEFLFDVSSEDEELRTHIKGLGFH